MDKRTLAGLVEPKEAGLLTAAVRTLEEYGIPAEIQQLRPKPKERTRTDAAFRLTIGGRTYEYVVEIKRWLTPATVGQVAARMGGLGKNALLVTNHVTPPVADRLKELDIPFVDAAGNAYLRRPPVFIWVVGRKPLATEKPARNGRAFQATGLQLIFALLCKPELATKPLRDIATFAGVAHGTAGAVMTELREQGYLVEQGTTRARVRRLRDRAHLLNQWAEAYARTLRPQLLFGRYEAPQPDWWKKADVAKYKALLGAEPAAAIATNHLRPGVVTLYARELPARLIVAHQLRKAEAGTVELRRRFWPFDYEWRYPTLVPPILVYADLLATGDARCVETARLLYDKYLDRLIKED